MCRVCFLSFFFFSLFSRVFLVCQLIIWQFQSIIRQLICCCFMSFQMFFFKQSSDIGIFYTVLILIKGNNLVGKINNSNLLSNN